jgi:hypothetical protein
MTTTTPTLEKPNPGDTWIGGRKRRDYAIRVDYVVCGQVFYRVTRGKKVRLLQLPLETFQSKVNWHARRGLVCRTKEAR